MNLDDWIPATEALQPLRRDAARLAKALPEAEPGSALVLAFGQDAAAFQTALLATWLRGHAAIVVENSERERIQPALAFEGAQRTTLHDTTSGRLIQVPRLLAREDVDEAPEVDKLGDGHTTSARPSGNVLAVHVQCQNGRRQWCTWTAHELRSAIDTLIANNRAAQQHDDPPSPGQRPIRTPGQVGTLFLDTLVALRRGVPPALSASPLAGRAGCSRLPIAGVPALDLAQQVQERCAQLLAESGIDDVAAVQSDEEQTTIYAVAGANADSLASQHPGEVVAFDEVPRDPNGQARATAIFLAAGRGRQGQEIARGLDWQECSRTEQSASYRSLLPNNYLFYEGHFDGYPVMAGGAQLHELVLPCLRRACRGLELPQLTELDGVKFLARFQPGDTIDVQLTRNEAGTRISFEIKNGDTRCTSGRCTFSSAAPPFV